MIPIGLLTGRDDRHDERVQLISGLYPDLAGFPPNDHCRWQQTDPGMAVAEEFFAAPDK
jgi:hypothetical protein